MKTRGIILFSVTLLLVSLVVFALNLYQEGAASDISSIDANQNLDLGPSSMPQAEMATEVVQEPLSEKSRDDAISLIYGWTKPLLSQRGWLHVKVQVIQSGWELGSLPDGKPIPQDYLSEKWYFLDERGLVLAAVSKMYDLEGQEVQSSTFENLTWTNLTYGFSDPGEYFFPKLDNEVSSILASIGRDGTTTGFEINERLLSDRSVLEVITFEDFETPLALEGVPEKVARIISRSVFDIQSGAPISFEKILRSPDGQERTITIVSNMVVERIDSPPSSILAFFREVPQ